MKTKQRKTIKGEMEGKKKTQARKRLILREMHTMLHWCVCKLSPSWWLVSYMISYSSLLLQLHFVHPVHRWSQSQATKCIICHSISSLQESVLNPHSFIISLVTFSLLFPLSYILCSPHFTDPDGWTQNFHASSYFGHVFRDRPECG